LVYVQDSFKILYEYLFFFPLNSAYTVFNVDMDKCLIIKIFLAGTNKKYVVIGNQILYINLCMDI